MYHVVINDYKNKRQETIHKTVYVDDAMQRCEEAAVDIVLKIEGMNYLQKLEKHMHLRKRKSILPEGYSVIKSKSCFTKYTILYKEPNGYIRHGDLYKLFTVFVVKIKGSILPNVRDQSEMDSVSYENYSKFLELLPSAYEAFEIKKKINLEEPN